MGGVGLKGGWGGGVSAIWLEERMMKRERERESSDVNFDEIII